MTIHSEKNAYIGLGSNVGEREEYLRRAVLALQESPGVRVTDLSALYETDPVGYTRQGAFLNMAARVKTTLKPEDLLSRMLQVERNLGRVRHIRWGPRTIDLDLLLYDHTAMKSEYLTLPHPRMLERAFVLVPLADILRPGTYPFVDAAIRETGNTNGKDGVRLWKEVEWLSAFEPFAN